MKTMIITECENRPISNVFSIDLNQTLVKDCSGCWTCWWRTPGKCSFRDLDEFYHEYITADKVIVFSKVTKGFVSGKLKTLFDRMIPLYLPYISYSSGESMHIPRYEKYPQIEFYYEGEFATQDGRKIFEDYVNRVFYQFCIKNYSLKPIKEFNGGEVI